MVSAKGRYTLLYEASKDTSIQAQCLASCKDPDNGILFWFDHFAYTYNPRLQEPDLPFNLMPFQKVTVKTLHDCIVEGEPILIEKSRDMGLTWIVGLTCQYFWQFLPGSDFHFGSKKQDLVDKKGDMSTIFQKIRYNISKQPNWMLPKLGKNDDTFLKLIHPVNRNTITGEASGPDFGRGGRYKAAVLDEMAFHPYGKAAYESVSHSTDCIIMPSTPNGKTNEFYKLRNKEDIEWVDIKDESD